MTLNLPPMTKEERAVYLVGHVGYTIQEAAKIMDVSEFWLNLRFPEERKTFIK